MYFIEKLCNIAGNINEKTFTKIISKFIIMIFVLLLPMLLLSNYCKDIIKMNEIKSSSNYLNTISIVLDKLFVDVRNLAYSIRVSKNYTEMSTINDVTQKDYSLKAIKTIDLLRQVLNSNDIIDNAVVYYKNLELIMDNNGTYDYKFYISNYHGYNCYPREYWDELFEKIDKFLTLPSTSVYKYSDNTEKNYYKAVIPVVFKIHNNFNNQNYLIVNINENKILQLMNNLNFSKKGFVLIYDSINNSIITNTNNNEIDNNIIYNGFKDIYNNMEGAMEVNYKKKSYIMSYKRSSFEGLYYLVLTPKTSLMEEVDNFKNMLILIFVSSMLIGVIGSFYFSKKLYSPIYDIINFLKENSGLDNNNSSKDDYTNIMSIIKELVHNIKSNEPHLIQTFLYKSIYNDLDDSIDSRIFTDAISHLNDGIFIVCLIHIDYLRNCYKDHDNTDYNTLNNTIEANIISKLSDCFNKFYTITISKNEFVLLIKGNNHEDVTKTVNEFKEEVNTLLFNNTEYISINVALSDIFGDITLIKEYFEKVHSLMDFRNISSNKIFYSYNDIVVDKKSVFFTDNDKQQLVDYIEHSTIKEIMGLVDNIITKHAKECSSWISTKQLAYEIVVLVYEICCFSDTRNSIITNSKGDILIKINSLHSMEALKEYIEDIIRKLIELNQTDIKSKDDIVQILDYVDKNITEVCLYNLAFDMKMNANYLSQYFKKKTGMTFQSYINSKRIVMAKDLLDSTDLNINVISQKVGFNNINAFIRMFKKMVGITPGEYRKDNNSSIHKPITYE